jgi:hypothetical protein
VPRGEALSGIFAPQEWGERLVRLQLLVAQPPEEPRLYVVAGPTFQVLVAALQGLPRRTYAAPDFWVVDREGLLQLHDTGLKVEEGALEPSLRHLAHRVTLGLARGWLAPWRPSTEDGIGF